MTWVTYVSLGLNLLLAGYMIMRDTRKTRIAGEAGATEAQVNSVKEQCADATESLRESLRTLLGQLNERITSVEQRATEARQSLAEELFRLVGRVNMFIEMTHERAKLRVDDVHHPDAEHSVTDALLDKFREDRLRDDREIRQLIRAMSDRKQDGSLSKTEQDAASLIYWSLRLKYPI